MARFTGTSTASITANVTRWLAVVARGTIERWKATFFTRFAFATRLAAPASSPAAKKTQTVSPVSRKAG